MVKIRENKILETKNILVIDDDKLICKVIYDIITKKFSSISVETVDNGNEALEKIKSNNYDLIFLDINLGNERASGLEILKKIKNINAEQNVYMITGYSVEDETEQIIRDNSIGLLYKPFRLSELVKIIQKFLKV